MKRPGRLALAAAFAALLGVYLPDLGRGFVKDDFGWIGGSRVERPVDLVALFRTHNGFYRPFVSLTFAANERLFGLEPVGYGLTNLLLLLAAAAALRAVAGRRGLAPGAAFFAAALWALNPHGINMAVLWISGRTALLLALLSLLSAWALLSGRSLTAALLCLAALFSKEEAVLLPAILWIWASAAPERRWDLRRGAARAWPLLVPLALYLILRSETGAYLPTTAPRFYRFTFAPAALARNVLEYADRAMTFGVAVLVLLAAVLGRRPRLGPAERRGVALGLVWLALGYGLTVLLPVRSSLYACFPSGGAALAAAFVASALWREGDPRGRRRALVAAGVLPLLLVPVYRSRNARWVRPAELSARVLAALKAAEPEIPPGTALVLADDPEERFNLAAAFGTVIEDAVRLALDDPRRHVWIEPPPPDWEGAGLRPPAAGEPIARFALRGGSLRPERAGPP